MASQLSTHLCKHAAEHAPESQGWVPGPHPDTEGGDATYPPPLAARELGDHRGCFSACAPMAPEFQSSAAQPRGTKRPAAAAASAHIDGVPDEDQGGDKEPGPRNVVTPRRTTRTTPYSFLSRLKRRRIDDGLETAEGAPDADELWVAVGEDRCKPCILVGREVCKPQWNGSEPCKSCVFCKGQTWSCNPPDSWLKKVASVLHPKQTPPKRQEDKAALDAGGSSETAEAAPPITEVAAVKRRTGHQKGVKVTLAASDLEDLEDTVLAMEQAIQGIQGKMQALKSNMDEIGVMIKALCLRIKPSAAAPSESSIRCMLAVPVSGSTARRPVPKYAGVTRNAGDEEPPQGVQRIGALQTSNNEHNLAAKLVVFQGRMDRFEERMKDAGL